MVFHRPGRAGDLPPLPDLWARAALLAALPPRPTYTADGEGVIRFDDGAGSRCELVPVAGGRAVLTGTERHCDEHIHTGVDPLDGAPGWLPWTRLADHEIDRPPGLAYWWDGSAWNRIDYDDRVEDDGLSRLVGHLADDASVRTWIAAGLDVPADLAPELDSLVTDLLARARSARLTREEVDRALALYARCPGYRGNTDAPAALAAAARLGLTPGVTPPALPAGTAAPVRTRLLGDYEEMVSLWLGDDLRRRAEIPGRPAPGPSPALDALAAWTRAQAPGGTAVLLHERIGRTWGFAGSGPEPLYRRSPHTEPMSLLDDLHGTESHPEHGGWCFLRLEVAPTGATALRAYDHWPSWFPADGHGWEPTAVQAAGSTFLRDLGERAPEWRHPLDGRRRTYELPDGPDTVPGAPWVPLAPGEREDLESRVAAAFAEGAGGARVRGFAAMLGGRTGVHAVAEEAAGGTRRLTVPAAVRTPLERLRRGMYEPGTGTWFRADVTVEPDGTHTFSYDRDSEPDFGHGTDRRYHVLDFRCFPRAPEHVPDWWRDRLGL
ncbi:hypothetical protein SUDANB121_04559 [Nocardiopsis dassonvillei]|uniref:hypothetical protein n=1 Tax=Nocardiopsis dassonvillei TaxID=2014 RepID=UPI003F56FD9A